MNEPPERGRIIFSLFSLYNQFDLCAILLITHTHLNRQADKAECQYYHPLSNTTSIAYLHTYKLEKIFHHM